MRGQKHEETRQSKVNIIRTIFGYIPFDKEVKLNDFYDDELQRKSLGIDNAWKSRFHFLQDLKKELSNHRQFVLRKVQKSGSYVIRYNI